MRTSFGVGAVIASCAIACSFQRTSGVPGGGDGGPGDGDTVTDDARGDDSPSTACDAVTCSQLGGQCDALSGHCVIDANGAGKVICPSTLFCEITCDNATDTCSMGVDCSAAKGCIVTCGAGGNNDNCQEGGIVCPLNGPCTATCNGNHACRHAPVVCGTGRCETHCIGSDACGDHGIQCSASTECIAECKGTNACLNGGIDCGSGTCTAVCNGGNACENETCNGTPSSCTFNCCGGNACANGALCGGCSKGNVCP